MTETTGAGGALVSGGDLDQQNVVFSGTGGVSRENRAAGFRPAFRHRPTGEVRVSSYADGSPAPVHVLDGLPDAWLSSDAPPGQRNLLDAVEVGFVRDERFYSREQAAVAIQTEGD